MSNKQILKVMINERLSEAAEEIFALFEQAVAEYQREIDRLKNNASETKQMEVVQSPQLSSEVAQLTETVGEENQENTGSFPGEVEDEPHLLITNVKSLISDDELQLQGQQQKVNSEGPQEERASGGAETDNSSKSRPETEEEDPDTASGDAPKNPFSCSVCKMSFPHLRCVKTHIQRAHAEPVTSADCNAQLDTEQQSSSQPGVDSSKDKPFSCPICQERFPVLKRVKVHMRSHTYNEQYTSRHHSKPNTLRADLRPFRCSVCGELFRQKCRLLEHMKTHTEYPFSCTKCTDTFTREAQFIRHMKTAHATERPYACSVCNQGCKNAQALRLHMLTHSGERPFLCAVCGRGFIQRSHLKYHELSHSGEKPFGCAECGAKYTTKRNLAIHKKVHQH